jgi:hypothetical protein
VCKLDAPIFLDDMRNHRVLSTAGFIRKNMQGGGGLLVSGILAVPLRDAP